MLVYKEDVKNKKDKEWVFKNANFIKKKNCI